VIDKCVYKNNFENKLAFSSRLLSQVNVCSGVDCMSNHNLQNKTVSFYFRKIF
jgi:hypothetical protein